jgi:hypothetical protein
MRTGASSTSTRTLLGKSKVSYTHLIGWGIVKALKTYPSLNHAFVENQGQPYRMLRDTVNLGIAVDVGRGRSTMAGETAAPPKSGQFDLPKCRRLQGVGQARPLHGDRVDMLTPPALQAGLKVK